MKRKSILDEKQLEWKNRENAAKGHKKEKTQQMKDNRE